MAQSAPRRFTGYHMTAILVAFFGVVMTVNFTMAYFARTSFGGIVVENSYIASQEFNTWLDEAEAQRQLGWDAVTSREEDGRVRITVNGPGADAVVVATARHPLGRLPDREMLFERAPDGSFLSARPLPAGRWTIRMEVTEGDAKWRQEAHL